MPDLRQLRTFVAVAEELNFTRAAEHLNMAQQAVSKSVRQLERELGVELLERTTREVRLTPAGAALVESGRDVLAAADAAFTRAQEVGRGLTGRVTVGMSPAVGPAVHEDLIRALRAGAPDIAVSVLDVRPRDVATMLRDRELDMVIARTSSPAPEVDSAALRPTPVVLCVPETHRLASADGPVPLRELDGERLLVWSPPGTPFTDILLASVRAAGAAVEPTEARVTGSGLGLIELVEREAVALSPLGTPPVDGIVQLEVAEDLTLPLVVMWPAGAMPEAVRRVRAELSGVPPA